MERLIANLNGTYTEVKVSEDLFEKVNKVIRRERNKGARKIFVGEYVFPSLSTEKAFKLYVKIIPLAKNNPKSNIAVVVLEEGKEVKFV